MEIIDHEIKYLIDKRQKDSIGGWRYFYDVKEIAADIDDLGQMIQVLINSNNKTFVEKYCEVPIKVVLNNNLNKDGSILTWIIPKENLNELQKKQVKLNKTKWGES